MPDPVDDRGKLGAVLRLVEREAEAYLGAIDTALVRPPGSDSDKKTRTKPETNKFKQKLTERRRRRQRPAHPRVPASGGFFANACSASAGIEPRDECAYALALKANTVRSISASSAARARRIQHEICPVLADELRGAIDQPRTSGLIRIFRVSRLAPARSETRIRPSSFAVHQQSTSL